MATFLDILLHPGVAQPAECPPRLGVDVGVISSLYCVFFLWFSTWPLLVRVFPFFSLTQGLGISVSSSSRMMFLVSPCPNLVCILLLVKCSMGEVPWCCRLEIHFFLTLSIKCFG